MKSAKSHNACVVLPSKIWFNEHVSACRLLLQLSHIQQQLVQSDQQKGPFYTHGQDGNGLSVQADRLSICFVIATVQVEAAAQTLQVSLTLLLRVPPKHTCTSCLLVLCTIHFWTGLILYPSTSPGTLHEFPEDEPSCWAELILIPVAMFAAVDCDMIPRLTLQFAICSPSLILALPLTVHVRQDLLKTSHSL